MTPIDYYHEQCNKGVIHSDSNQLLVLQKLQRVYAELLVEHKKRFGILRIFYKPRLVEGIYLWGGVGIGKTFLMDCFYNCLPFDQKIRMHFHKFMQHIHDKLKIHQGEIDPLQAIAAELAKQTIVLCFDEFFVSDIADAMLLGRLLKTLFAKGVCLVTTSNTKPDDLYKNGLQRLQFLPAIALLKKNTEIIHISSDIDYRLRHLKEAGVFYMPLGKIAEENMQKTFAILSQGRSVDFAPILINGRLIQIKKQTGDIVWFDFMEICSVPRSQHDYLVIAEKYRTVFISNIPVIAENARDTICLFVNLIDVLYDARVKLVVSAEESVPELYSRGYMLLEYTRTNSRLLEMQSLEYFSGEEK